MAAVIPYLCASDAAGAIEFYKKAFGATEVLRMTDDKGKVGHAEITIDGARVMVADEWPEGGVYSPQTLGGTPVSFALEVDDVDTVFDQAVAAGATVERAVADQAYGERSGWLVDPFGHRWSVSTRIEDLSKDDLRERVRSEYDVS
jgi:PhnB protein